MTEKNLRLANDDSRLRRKVEDRDRIISSSEIEKNQIVLENKRLENELSLVQSQLTDSSSKIQMFQNVHDELATTKIELKNNKREMTEIAEINLRLTNEDSRLRRKIEDRDRLIASSQAEVEELKNCMDEQKLDKVHEDLTMAKRELELGKRAVTRLEKRTFRLMRNDKWLKRKMENTNRLLLSGQAELKNFRVCIAEQQLDTRELAKATRELESKNKTISELEAKNLSLDENDSKLRRIEEPSTPVIEIPEIETACLASSPMASSGAIENNLFVLDKERLENEIKPLKTSSQPENVLNISCCNEPRPTIENLSLITGSPAAILPDIEFDIKCTKDEKKPPTVKSSSTLSTNRIKNIIKNIFSETSNLPSDEFVVRGKQVKMQIDSGSPASFLTKQEWKRIGKPPLTPVKGYSFKSMSGRSAELKGMFMASVVYENTSYLLPLYVSSSMKINVVGRTWLSDIKNVDWNIKVFSDKFEKIQQESLKEVEQYCTEIPTLNLAINGFPIKAEIDTGLSKTVITKKTWEEIGKPRLRKSIFPFLDTCFNKIPIKGLCAVTINERKYSIIVLKESKLIDQCNSIGMDDLGNLENIDLNETFKNLNKT
jgi:myosin heavy subunit